ncbi:hypothetical protein GCM10023196_032220 [Actinoallomurus vinaceus]|uniref:Transcriptional regulator n=1 Tax=Actinoallomurus vinaceus TaxID=1080074 RepID=A0ABP8U7V0_9ACTN
MSEPNEVLSRYLLMAGWNPKVFARKINKLCGFTAVAETAPYYWRDEGGVPHPPIPQVAAHVLSQELGRAITVEELWKGRAAGVGLWISADAGMDDPWTIEATAQLIEEWLLGGLMDRRTFLAVSGPALTGLAWQYLGIGTGRLAAATAGGRVDDPLVDQIEESIPRLQRLDDAFGGGRHLDYIGAQFRTVGLLIRNAADDRVRRRLLIAFTDIGQLAGWMALDAGKPGLCQRYLFTALRAAHDCGYGSMGAHILADLAYQSASQGDAADAVELGEAALKAASDAPASVRAAVMSRLSYAYAVADRHRDFEYVRQQALHVLAERDLAKDPAWLYYLTPGHLDAQAGYGLVHLGRLCMRTEDKRRGRRLIAEGETLLRAESAYDRPLNDPQPRRALHEGAWLSLGCAAHGRLEEACDLARTAIKRLDRVRSARSLALLKQLADDLRRRQRNEYARDFLPELEAALARHAA